MKNLKQPKSNKMKKKELQQKKFFNEQQVEIPQPVVHTVLKTKVRNLKKAIEDIFAGEFIHCHDKKINAFQEYIKHHRTPSLKRIILHFLEQKIDFIESINHNINAKVPIKALIDLSKYLDKAIRPIEDWDAPSHNTHRSISSFARHLYAKYHVPAFMDDSWYSGSITHQNWFIHIGQGQNIRTAWDLPIPLTKREAHFFLQAPKDFTPLYAIRYGQIVNMGGNESFVRQILKTRIAIDFNRDRVKFWQSIFAWLLANPMLDTSHYAPILDYINNQKYEGYRLDEHGVMVPRQPNFCMKGRDPETLLRQVEVWHKQTGKEGRHQFPIWASCGRKEFFHKSNEAIHTIKEICTQKDLQEEGRKMHHCVGSYAASCARGDISIWSYEVMNDEGLNKKLTLEVNNRDATIKQARGKYNVLSKSSDMYFVKMWAKEAGLSISKYLI